MLDWLGIMCLSAVLVVMGNALGNRRAGHVLVISGMGVAAALLTAIVLSIAWAIVMLAND